MDFKEFYNKQIKEIELKTYDSGDNDVINWQPETGTIWNRGTVIKSKDNYFIKSMKDGGTLLYGIFLDTDKTNDCLANISLDITTDYSDILGIKPPIPLVMELRVKHEYRGKGLAKLLYKTALDRHGIILSDTTLYEGAYKLWMTYIRSLPIDLYLVNYVDEWIKPFDETLALADINTRIMAVSLNRYKSTIKHNMEVKNALV